MKLRTAPSHKTVAPLLFLPLHDTHLMLIPAALTQAIDLRLRPIKSDWNQRQDWVPLQNYCLHYWPGVPQTSSVDPHNLP